ncbi:MAG: cyclase family protein [Bradymonadaceae bacterium]
MNLVIHLGDRSLSADLDRPIDISIPLDFHGKQPSAFFLRPARSRAFEAGDFVGDVRRGGSANCETVELSPHGNGTHTECIGHITEERVHIGEALQDVFVLASVVSVHPVELGGSGESYGGESAESDLVITRRSLEEALKGDEPHNALIVRTLPNELGKLACGYSGQNPAYFTHEAMTVVREHGIEHLLVDLPSVDREDDGGALSNHHIFWSFDDEMLRPAALGWTITEMIYVPNEVRDGEYLLTIQVPHFLLDAAPSRPLLFEILD